jgi:hypothetical protein
MAMTADNVTDLIRSMISENSAKYWTAAEITLYETMAMNKLLSRWAPWLYHEYGTWADFAITVNTTEYDKPTNCYKIAWLLVKETGGKCRYIGPDEFFKYRGYSDDNPLVWTMKANQIHIVPTPSATDSDYLEIHYMPIMDAVTEFPDQMRPLIVLEAVELAKYKDSALGPDIFQLKKDYETAILHDLAFMQREPIIFGDYEDEQGYA